MKKLLLLLCTLLTAVSGAWADVLPGAVVGTYAFQATTLTAGASGHTISKDASGNVSISPNNSGAFGATSGRFTCTLVVKINVPSTTTAGVLCDIRSAAGETGSSQGLYMAADRKLQTKWQNSARTDGTTLTAGEHTIIYTTGESGATVYVDGTSKLTDSDLKKQDFSYKCIYIPSAYASCITEVHFFASIQSAANITAINTECTNRIHASQQTAASVTVPSGKTLVIDKDDNLSKYTDASSIAIAAGKTLTLNKDNSTISSLTGSGTALQSTDITTTVAGNLSDLTLKATAGTLTYTGTNLNGSTLDGVILGGTERITTSNTVNIKNLAGNNLNNTTNKYAFIGSGTLNFYGTCDLTKKADGTDCNSSKIGYGSAAYINIKDGANVTTAGIFNTDGSTNNANITVESGATLTATGTMRSISATNNGTMSGTILYGPITLGDGSITTMSDATPFNDNYTAGTGAVTVNGDATLNLTATTSTLNKAITVAASKTLTIDGGSNTVNLNVVPTFGASSKINFKNATINYPSGIRNLANYTFTSSTAQFTETGDEYKAGGFTITNISSGVTIKVKKYGATDYETVTPTEGTATISHEVGVSGTAAWLDYTFNLSTIEANTHSPADRVIDNAGNAGVTGHNLTIDTGYNTDNSYNADGTLKVMSTPWRDITWPSNYTVAVAGNVPDVENGCLVAFGSSVYGSKKYLAIIRGASQNEIKLVKGSESSAYEVISTMTAANATALSHLVVFTKNGNTFTVYLDGVQKTQVTYSETLGTGFQIGSVHGGVGSSGIVRVSSMDDAVKSKIFAKAIRVYDYVISADQMSQLTEEFPYTSYGGKYTRTISANSNLSATNAWLNAGTQGLVDVPVNATVETVTYYPDVEITTTTASTLTVNANMDTENIKFEGAGKLTIVSDGSHNINIYGSVTADGPVSVNYDQIDLTAVPVTIGESGSIEFDFSDHDFSSVITSTDYPVTGNTSDYGDKVTGVYPVDEDHSYTISYNGTTNSYYLTVAPTILLKGKLAIALVKPYYDDNYVDAGLGKYTISLGVTSYATLSDFETAVEAWESLGDYVEPTIAINQPTSAFYRIKSGTKYLKDVRKADNATQRLLTDAEGADEAAETIFYLDDDTFVGYKTGYGFGFSVCQTRDTEHINTQLFTGSAEMGKYTIQSQKGTYSSATDNVGYWGVDGSDLSRENDIANSACWTIEEVTSLPVSISSVGYATLNSPVALIIPANVTAYTGTINGSYLTLNELGDEDDVIPARTPVILKGTAGTHNFTISDSEATYSGPTNNLSGTTAAIAWTSGYYTLQKNKSSDVVGFYSTEVASIPGFKAYLASALGVKGFTFSFEDLDGINSVQGSGLRVQDSAIYNLAGQRMQRLQKGVNIVNGRKVLVK